MSPESTITVHISDLPSGLVSARLTYDGKDRPFTRDEACTALEWALRQFEDEVETPEDVSSDPTVEGRT